MRKYLLLSTLALLAACQLDRPEEEEENLVSHEIFTTSIGNQQVYGVQVRATTTRMEVVKNFVIELSQNEKTWMDTIHMDLTPGDTLESEVVFSEAAVEEGEDPEVKIEVIELIDFE